MHLVPVERATPLTSYDEIQVAMLAQQPITCRTSYMARGGERRRVVLEYPAKIVNVQHDRPNWQIDTGPILVPDFTGDERPVRRPAGAGLHPVQ